MPSEQAAAITAQLAALQAEIMGSGVRPSLDERRTAVDSFGDYGVPAEGVETSRVELGSCSALWHEPVGREDGPVLVHFHGGGLAMGSAHGWRNLAGHLAAASGAAVLNVDFRRAPEHPFPAGREDARAAYDWLLEQGRRPGEIFLGGDSAGAGLALGTARALRDEGGASVGGVYLLSPWIDFTLANPSLTGRAGVDVLTSKAALEMMRGFYAPGHDPADPRISPGLGELAGLPPLHVEASRDEILLDDAVRLAERAEASGVEVDLVLWEGVPHVHQLFVGNLPEADEAVQLIARWVRAKAPDVVSGAAGESRSG